MDVWDAFTDTHCRAFAADACFDPLEASDFVEYARLAYQQDAIPLDGSWRTLLRQMRKEHTT